MRFESPPQRQRTRHTVIAAELKKRPGQWAAVAVYAHIASASGTAHRINNGLNAAYLPAGAFEATGRTVNGEARLYVRYVGEGRDA